MKRIVLASLCLAAVALAQDAPPATQDPPQTTTGPATLKEAVKFEKRRPFVDPQLSVDGEWLYVLDLGSKILKFRTDTLTVTAELPALRDARTLTLSPDGKKLYVGACAFDGASSAFQTIDTATFKAEPEFWVDGVVVCGMAATDAGIIACVMPGAKQGVSNRFFVVDVATQKAIANYDITKTGQGRGTSAASPRMRMPLTQDRVFIKADYGYIIAGLKDGGERYVPREAGLHGSALGLDFAFSPNGKLLLATGGTVVALEEGRPRPFWKLDSWICGAYSPDSKSFMVAREEGKLRRYDVATKKPTGAYRLAETPTTLLWESKRNRIIALTPKADESTRMQTYELTAYEAPQ